VLCFLINKAEARLWTSSKSLEGI